MTTRSFGFSWLSLIVAAGLLVARGAQPTAAPGTDDLSRYAVMTSAPALA